MELLLQPSRKRRFLKEKAEELRSLKRQLNTITNQLDDILQFSRNEDKLAKRIYHLKSQESFVLLELDQILSENGNVEEANETKKTRGIASIKEIRKELAGELYQYGFEVKYLPLARYLQTAAKYISTENWSSAREEFRLARIFEKFLELRNSKALSSLQINHQTYPTRTKTHQDYLIEEAVWMSKDFREERRWKINVAKILAEEAVTRVKCHKDLICTEYDGSGSNEYFYQKDDFEISSQSNIPVFEGNEMAMEHDVLKEACNLGYERLLQDTDIKSFQDLIPSIEYQICTSPASSDGLWMEHEDCLLLKLADRFLQNWKLISHCINGQIYAGKAIRTQKDCQARYLKISAVRECREKADAFDSEQNFSNFIHPLLIEQISTKFNLMKSQNTKIITPRSVVPKKISFVVHPSHEAAARKANQNISKLLTPSELAQKRIQRTRFFNDPNVVNAPAPQHSTENPNPNPNSTPTPNPSNVPVSTSNQLNRESTTSPLSAQAKNNSNSLNVPGITTINSNIGTNPVKNTPNTIGSTSIPNPQVLLHLSTNMINQYQQQSNSTRNQFQQANNALMNQQQQLHAPSQAPSQQSFQPANQIPIPMNQSMRAPLTARINPPQQQSQQNHPNYQSQLHQNQPFFMNYSGIPQSSNSNPLSNPTLRHLSKIPQQQLSTQNQQGYCNVTTQSAASIAAAAAAASFVNNPTKSSISVSSPLMLSDQPDLSLLDKNSPKASKSLNLKK